MFTETSTPVENTPRDQELGGLNVTLYQATTLYLVSK